MSNGEVENIVMQPRCVFCKHEHPIAAVYAMSHGNAACHNCGRTPPVYRDVELYRKALKTGWQ